MIALTVNGTPREVDAPADKPLLWVLREDLDIVGPKFGCRVRCLHRARRRPGGSLLLAPVGCFAGKSIVTIEGLGEGRLHPVQRAWIDEN